MDLAGSLRSLTQGRKSSGMTSTPANRPGSERSICSTSSSRPSSLSLSNEEAKRHFREEYVPQKSEKQLLSEYAEFELEDDEEDSELFALTPPAPPAPLSVELHFQPVDPDAKFWETGEHVQFVDLDAKYRLSNSGKKSSFLGEPAQRFCESPVQEARLLATYDVDQVYDSKSAGTVRIIETIPVELPYMFDNQEDVGNAVPRVSSVETKTLYPTNVQQDTENAASKTSSVDIAIAVLSGKSPSVYAGVVDVPLTTNVTQQPFDLADIKSLPGIEHLTNIQARTLFVEYNDMIPSQREYFTAPATTDSGVAQQDVVEDICAIIDSYLDRTADGQVKFDYGSEAASAPEELQPDSPTIPELINATDEELRQDYEPTILDTNLDNDAQTDDTGSDIFDPQPVSYFDAQTQAQVGFTAMNQLLQPQDDDEVRPWINRAEINGEDEFEQTDADVREIVHRYIDAESSSSPRLLRERLPACLRVDSPIPSSPLLQLESLSASLPEDPLILALQLYTQPTRRHVPSSVSRWRRKRYVPRLSFIAEDESSHSEPPLPSPCSSEASIDFTGYQAGIVHPKGLRRSGFMDDEVPKPESASDSEHEYAIDRLGNFVVDASGERVLLGALCLQGSDEPGFDVQAARRRALEKLQGEVTAYTDCSPISEASLDFTNFRGAFVRPADMSVTVSEGARREDEAADAKYASLVLDGFHEISASEAIGSIDETVSFVRGNRVVSMARAITMAKVEAREVTIAAPATSNCLTSVDALFATEVWASEPDLELSFIQ